MKKTLTFQALVVAALVFLVVASGCRKRKNVYAVGPQDITHSEFLLVLFPLEEVPGCDRAVIVNLEEYIKDEIEVFVEGKAVTLPKELFTPEPTVENLNGFVEKLNYQISQWGDDTDWSSVEYSFVENDRTIAAALVVYDKFGGKNEYSYLVKSGDVDPIGIKMEVDVAKKMAH